MTFLRRVLNLDTPDSQELPVDPDAPIPDAGYGETASVQAIAKRLQAFPPARARFIAAFAYLLGRAANASNGFSDAERKVMLGLAETGGLDEDTGRLVVDLAGTFSDTFGATEDYLVTREFKAISTMDERKRLLRACFMVMAADDEIDATESWLVNRMAEELDVERPDLNEIRAEFHEQLSGIKALRSGAIEDAGTEA
jgi:uncharacterized tellurite resistance protein B-like protein